jgi:superfamily II DNA or RNA helicase
MIEITEKFLVSIGGWPAMKQARAIHAAGRVTDASYVLPMLRGRIHDGGKEFISALRIRNSIDIENLCPCRESKLRGLICAHVMAVGLEVISPNVRKTASSPTPQTSTSHSSVSAEIPNVRLSIEGSLRHLEATVEFSYQSPGLRNPAAEFQVMTQLLDAGFANEKGKAVMKNETAILKFHTSVLPALGKEWTVSVGERFQHVTRDFIPIRPVCRLDDDGSGWLDFHVHYAAGAEAIFSHADLQRVLDGSGVVKLKSGKMAMIDSQIAADVDEVLRDCDPHQERGRFRVHPRQRGYLEASLAKWDGKETSSPIQTPPLGTLESKLRPYQSDGARWLLQRAIAGLGGLLADEMGLGKTVQALAMIEALRLSGDTRPALVVCPSSLVWNWQSEAKRFLPDLDTLALSGPDRTRLFERIPSAHLVITSYALLRRDIEHLKPHKFSTIILDEAQHIKNPDSQNAKAAASLRGASRFILTGTPVENALSDLWSLFDFLLPGYLGGRKDFRDRYEEPLEAPGSSDTRERLARRLGPYVLRRLKVDILADLPPKLEQILEIELTPKQKAAYTQIQSAARDQIDALREKSGDAAARMRVLTALLRLRQVACDLRLVNPNNSDPAEASAKLDALRELVSEAMDGGHRVLVFSQFTSMLDKIGEAMETDEIRFCRLDGTTRDRQSVVERFQSDSTIPVFLISLKAGGVGLNLTGADTVIHFDPWWNPAVEAQATDRAHRIGQQRVVTSIKLIARDTVEQRVLALQQKKRTLFENAIEADQLAPSLNLEDIRELIG